MADTLIDLNRVFSEALSRGADFAELYAERTEQQSLELLDGVVSQATHTQLQGAGIRVLKGEHTGYAYVMSFQPDDLLRAARFAAGIAAATTASQAVSSLAPVELFLQPASPVQLNPSVLHRLESLACSLDARVVKVKAIVAYTATDVMVANSLGEAPVRDHRPRTAIMLNVVMEQDGRHEMGFASEQLAMGLELLSDERLQRVAHRAVSQASHLFEAVTPEGGDMPVVMGAGASGILLHEAIGHAFEADFNRLGTSIFTDCIGQQICRPGISIVDDATLPLSAGSYAFDDEGNPAHCTYLVRDGRLESYLHDRISARHYGVTPTGNGRRQSFRHAPIPRMTNTYMLAGDASEDDIIRSVKRGIYAQTFTNGQVQIGAGDFTFFLKTGFLIEDGHLTQPIRDVNIIGNGPRALADISMVGNNLLMDQSAGYCGKSGQQVPVGQGIPTVLVDRLTVGGV